MKELTERTLWVSLKIIFYSAIISGLIFSLGVGFALYLVPINMVIVVHILLKEVDKIANQNDSKDVAV